MITVVVFPVLLSLNVFASSGAAHNFGPDLTSMQQLEPSHSSPEISINSTESRTSTTLVSFRMCHVVTVQRKSVFTTLEARGMSQFNTFPAERSH